jgi:flagellar biosynthesis/type III secretory pathway protein FliH
MKHWGDPNQRPLVRPVLFEEVGSAPRAPSPFFEGRSPASYTESPVHEPAGSGEAYDAGSDAFGQEFGGEAALDGFGSGGEGAAFDPIVPAEALDAGYGAPAHQGQHAHHAPAEPEEDPRVHEALGALGASLQGLVAARAEALAAAEHDVIRLAVALAKRIVGAEIRQRPELLLAAAREGIHVLAESDRYVVRVASGPAAEHVEALRAELAQKFPRSEVIVDERLAPFTCIVESEHGRVDESTGARMGAVLEQAGLTKVAGGA